MAQALATHLGQGALLLGTLPARTAGPGVSCRDLLLVLGDQLDRHSPLLVDGDRGTDRVLMLEARSESTRVPSHKARSVLFLSAMRHHADWLRNQGWRLIYVEIDAPQADSFASGLADALQRWRPRRLRLVEPGEYGVAREIRQAADAAGVTLDIVPDPHFLCSIDDFRQWAGGRKVLVMEHFYRAMRKRHRVLLDGGEPIGGKWNFDASNRRAFGREGPGLLPAPPRFAPDTTTRDVVAAVGRHFGDNPGRLDDFDWPVTREQALIALADFVDHRLAAFGPFQDAIWDGEPTLYHSRLAAAMNLKLLSPREVIDAALAALGDGRAQIASVEGFVRQVLGWREYVRGVYWTQMPGYLDRNALGADAPLPAFYWDGDTDMACLRATIAQTLRYGYAHHIQRLMITGLFGLLLGVRPREMHTWYLSVYVDAVEWVEAPNTIGMSQYADGGLLASKPYAASGRYIQRMSNHCGDCRYRPDRSEGPDACPFTVLYWDFLRRHAARFRGHPRAGMQWRMLDKRDAAELDRIRSNAARLRETLA